MSHKQYVFQIINSDDTIYLDFFQLPKLVTHGILITIWHHRKLIQHTLNGLQLDNYNILKKNINK